MYIWYVLNKMAMRLNFIIRDVTSVTATIWKITISDKPSNCELAWNKKKNHTAMKNKT